jgi:cell wall-associated NlpC family hydrolase
MQQRFLKITAVGIALGSSLLGYLGSQGGSQAEVKQSQLATHQPSPGFSGLPALPALPTSLGAAAESTLLSVAPNLSLSATPAPVTGMTAAEAVEFDKLVQWAVREQVSGRPIGEIVQAVSEQFLGNAYREGLLDQTPAESLKITFHRFDCVLFVETVLALSRGIAVQDYRSATFTRHLEAQRYRDGSRQGYCSRLHYFSEWIRDNERRGTVTNLGTQLGGVAQQQLLSFMSSHWRSYPQMAQDPATRQCIAEVETQLRLDQLPAYIPTAQIRSVYPQLQPGDLIGITTNTAGLDVTHAGLVYRSANGQLGLIHAAPNQGVKISPDLQRFVEQVRDSTGILVARPNGPT